VGKREQSAKVGGVGKICGDKETRPRHQARASKNRNSVRIVATTESENRIARQYHRTGSIAPLQLSAVEDARSDTG
jgi:hypothetical protein